MANVRQAIEDGMNDAKWANARLAELTRERDELTTQASASGTPPQLDVDTVMEYRRKTEKVFAPGDPAGRKRLLRNWVQEVRTDRGLSAYVNQQHVSPKCSMHAHFGSATD